MKKDAVSPGANAVPPAAPFCAAAVDPDQFRDIWSGSTHSPERELAAAILDTAAGDLRNYYRYSHQRSRQRVYWQAYQWVAANDRGWPFSFVNTCEVLGLSAEALRARLLGPSYGEAANAQAA